MLSLFKLGMHMAQFLFQLCWNARRQIVSHPSMTCLAGPRNCLCSAMLVSLLPCPPLWLAWLMWGAQDGEAVSQTINLPGGQSATVYSRELISRLRKAPPVEWLCISLLLNAEEQNKYKTCQFPSTVHHGKRLSGQGLGKGCCNLVERKQVWVHSLPWWETSWRDTFMPPLSPWM